MAVKLVVEGNYLKFLDTADSDKELAKAPTGVIFVKTIKEAGQAANPLYYFTVSTTGNGDILNPAGTRFDDIVDSGGSAFGSIALLDTFLNTNTGLSTATGGGGGGGAVTIGPYATITSGEADITTAGTSEQGATITAQKITIIAKSTNVGKIYVGDSGIDNTKGSDLNKEDSEDFFLTNLNQLHFDVDNDGDGYTFQVFN